METNFKVDMPSFALGYSAGKKKGGGGPVVEKDVNFYDYDGTLLYSYTVEEAQALTKLPDFPERDGLTYQEWNWSLEDIKAYNRPVDVGAICISSDGATRIYIRLVEGRTSPMFGVTVNGVATVDWGDGTSPDTLTGTSVTTTVWTPNHNYASTGDYVIKLTIEGNASLDGILRQSNSSSDINYCYFAAIRKVIIGEGITYFSDGFRECYNLGSINIPNTVTNAGANIFHYCRSLRFCAIPSSLPTTSNDIFSYCGSLKNVSLPSNFKGNLNQLFMYDRGLKKIVLPDTITSIASSAFQYAEALETVVFSKNIKSIGSGAFSNCQSLRSIELPQGITTVNGFNQCYILASVTFPASVTSIVGNAFMYCNGLRYADFSKHTAVPTLSSTNAFKNNSKDFEIRVPAALYDEWIAATNWSTYADKIVAV